MRIALITTGGTIAERDSVRIAADIAGSGEGPTFIECQTVRLWGHYNRDIEHYRAKTDIADAEARDPIALLENRLLESGVALETQLSGIRASVNTEVGKLAEVALMAPLPDAANARHHVVAELAKPGSGNSPTAAPAKEMRYIEAVNAALRDELENRPETLVYGEDVAPAGGIFGATRNLQDEFGADRVFDTAIGESAILGSAVGAAICGWRPIVEIMWADFSLVALDQLFNQAANVRYITGGASSAPMVLRMQQGATPGSCAQHSQSLQSLFAHIPGLKVALPATPQDAYDMLRIAVADPDPCIIIEARALYQQSALVSQNDPGEPVGRARLRRTGNDVAIICWGTTVATALDAAEILADQSIESSVLNLRLGSPIDDDALNSVVADCGGRVVVAHEANITGGVGAEIVAHLTERSVAGQPVTARRVGTPDMRIPASPLLQDSLLPNRDNIIRVVYEIMNSGDCGPAKNRSRA